MRRCNHGHSAPERMLNRLPVSQAGHARHKCAICAYEKGLQSTASIDKPGQLLEKCNHGSTAPISVLDNLPESQAGIERHKCAVCAYRRGLESRSKSGETETSSETEQITHGVNLEQFIPDEEGRKKLETHVNYERSRKNRARAIQIHGTICAACGFDFDRVYGLAFAQSYIEIHHVTSLADQEGRPLDPEIDLVPLCSNCHSMAHRQTGKILSVQELRELIKSAKRG